MKTVKIDLSEYAIKVLLETSLSADIVKQNQDKYFITKTGYFLQNDEMCKINMNYNHHVNYQGLFYLDEALRSEEPQVCIKLLEVRAKQFIQSFQLCQKTQKEVGLNLTTITPTIHLMKLRKILDIGRNTGKFSMNIAKKDREVKITIADFPQQIKLSKINIAKCSTQMKCTVT